MLHCRSFSVTISKMAPKTRKTSPTETQRKGEKVKNGRRTQQLRQLPNPQLEALGLDNEEQNLRDVIKMMATINTKLAAHEVRMDDMASHVVVPEAVADVPPGSSCDAAEWDCPRVAVPDDQDHFHQMEEQVHCTIAECLRGALPAYLHIMMMMTQELTMRPQLSPGRSTKGPLASWGQWTPWW